MARAATGVAWGRSGDGPADGNRFRAAVRASGIGVPAITFAMVARMRSWFSASTIWLDVEGLGDVAEAHIGRPHIDELSLAPRGYGLGIEVARRHTNQWAGRQLDRDRSP